MSNPFRARPGLEGLDDRAIPNAAVKGPNVFAGLDVALEQFPTEPTSPVLSAPAGGGAVA